MCANRISHGQMRPVMSIESRQNIAQMKTPPLHRQNTVHPFAIADRILHRAVARRGASEYRTTSSLCRQNFARRIVRPSARQNFAQPSRIPSGFCTDENTALEQPYTIWRTATYRTALYPRRGCVLNCPLIPLAFADNIAIPTSLLLCLIGIGTILRLGGFMGDTSSGFVKLAREVFGRFVQAIMNSSEIF